MKKGYGRTREQKDYAERHPKCRICYRKTDAVHHINHNRLDDSDEELESLCGLHHVLEKGVHTMNEVEWIETMGLAKDAKWIARYERLKSRQEYRKKMAKGGSL